MVFLSVDKGPVSKYIMTNSLVYFLRLKGCVLFSSVMGQHRLVIQLLHVGAKATRDSEKAATVGWRHNTSAKLTEINILLLHSGNPFSVPHFEALFTVL